MITGRLVVARTFDPLSPPRFVCKVHRRTIAPFVRADRIHKLDPTSTLLDFKPDFLSLEALVTVQAIHIVPDLPLIERINLVEQIHPLLFHSLLHGFTLTF